MLVLSHEVPAGQRSRGCWASWGGACLPLPSPIVGAHFLPRPATTRGQAAAGFTPPCAPFPVRDSWLEL